MRNFIQLASLTAAAYAQVYYPTSEHDINNIRSIPLMPTAWLEGTTKYVIFVNDAGEYTITVEGKIDNNNGGPIEADAIDGVSRGFFF